MKNKFKVMLVIILTSLFSLSIGGYSAKAMWDGFNALDLYNHYGTAPYYHHNDKLYFAQKGGKATTGVRYKTVGQRVRVSAYSGGWVSLGADTYTMGAGNLGHENTTQVGNTLYDMWSIPLDAIRRYISPSSHYWNGQYKLQIILDSRYVKTVNGNDVCTNSHGWHTSGSNFRSYHPEFSAQHEHEMNSGLNRVHEIEPTQQPKPDPDMVRTDLWTEGGKNVYDDGKTMWMQPGRIEIRTWSYDLYPHWAGPEIQDKGSIKGSAVKVNGNDINISRKTNKYNGNFWYEQYDNTPEKNTGRIHHFGMQYPDENKNYYGKEYYSAWGSNVAWGGSTLVMTTVDGGIYDFQTDNYNDQGLWAAPGAWCYEFTGHPFSKNYSKLRADGDAPTTSHVNPDGKWDVSISVNSSDQVTITAKNVVDAGVGTELVDVALFPENVSGNDAQWFTMNKVAGTNNYQVVVDLSTYKFKDHFGAVNVHIYMRDKLKNREGQAFIFNRADVTPTLESIQVLDYEYKDSDNIYWVQANNTFNINVKSSVNSKFTGVFPTLNYGYWVKDKADHDRDNEIQFIYDSRNDSSSLGMNWKNTFRLSGSPRESLYTSNNKNLLESWVPAQAVDATHHGKILPLWGWAQTIYNGKTYNANDFYPSDKMMAIDAKAPLATISKVGINTMDITFVDNESGTHIMDVISGKTSMTQDEANRHGFRGDYQVNQKGTKTIRVDLGAKENCYIVYKDRVGNVGFTKVPDITKVNANITTSVIERAGKKYLLGNGTAAIIQSPVPNHTSTFTFSVTGDGSPNPVTQNNPMNANLEINDTYNTPDKPNIGYTDNFVSTMLNWQDMVDIMKSYNFRINSRLSTLPNEQNRLELEKNGVQFASGFKNYKYKLIQIGDHNFNPITHKVIKEDYVTKSELSMDTYPTARYRVEVTMFDFNGNPSGTGVLEFNHIKPEFSLLVTAVKDLDWETASYPFTYNSSQFPLGSKYKFNGEDISVGYAVNYHLSRERLDRARSISVKYRFIDTSNSPVTLSVGGVPLETLDIRENSNYTRENFNMNSLDGRQRAYLKHFIPASADATVNGSPYRGAVTVMADVTITSDAETFKKTYELYTVNMGHTALDDLGIDKQR